MAEGRPAKTHQHNEQNDYTFNSSHESLATTINTSQSMTMLSGPSQLYSIQNTITYHKMVAQLDVEEQRKLRELPASKLNEFFSNYKRMGDQGLTRIIDELEKLS